MSKTNGSPISATQIQDLREQSGAGIMDCKKALEESGGNLEKAKAWLRDRGVPPEKYPFAQDQTLGIWTTPDGSKVAWFKDPDGNILSISQHTS